MWKYIYIGFLCTVLFATPHAFSSESKTSASDINYDLFVSISLNDILKPYSSTRKTIAKSPVQISINDVNEQLIADINDNFFGQENLFWPMWNTETLQALLIDFSHDRAYLLNNQNPELGEIGARLDYALNDLSNGPYMSRSNRFGRTQLNGYDTYYLHSGALDYPLPSQEAVYASRMKLFIHESAHVIFQADHDFKGKEPETGITRGERFPIDILSRKYRNEIYHYLKLSILADTQKEKKKQICRAMYFHALYLEHNPLNALSARLDYLEGQATFIEYLFFEILRDDSRSPKDLYEATARAILDRSVDKQGRQVTIIQETEVYDIGGVAYAAAMLAGETGIIRSQISPFTFLSKRYKPLKTPPSEVINARLNKYYDPLQATGLTKVADIRRVLDNSQTAFLSIQKIPKAGMSMWANPIILDIDGKERALQIRSQSFSLGQGEVKLVQKSVIYSADNALTKTANSDDTLPAGEMVLPLNKNAITIEGDRISVQTDRLTISNVKYKKTGDHYILLQD